MRLLLAMCVLVLSAAPDLAGAVDRTGTRARQPIAFGRLDSDNNGYVSRVEARSIAPVESRFDVADRNRDNLLDRDEYLSLSEDRAGD